MTIPAARINNTYANAAAIQAISPNNRQDGDPAFNKGTGVQFHFDADSSAGASGDVLVPDAGSGRWIADATISGAAVAATLAATTAGDGSDDIGYDDSGNKTTAATVGDALDEVYLDRLTTSRSVGIPLGMWREVSAAGDVGNVAAIGGHLASDTAPILRAEATTNSWEISWATGNVDPIGCQLDLPADFDGTGPAYLDLTLYSGTTDAADMALATSWDGGSEVSDAADDSATKSATRHAVTITIAAADIPNTALGVTLRLTPPTHATNAIQLTRSRLRYTPKLLT